MLRERLTSAAFGAGWTLVCRMPESWARALFMAGAEIAWRREGKGVQVLEGNLIRVLRTIGTDSAGQDFDGAELRTLSRAVMRSYARYYLETFRLQTIPPERIRSGMHVNQANVDLTLEQFDPVPIWTEGPMAVGREYVLAWPDTRRRYEELRDRMAIAMKKV